MLVLSVVPIENEFFHVDLIEVVNRSGARYLLRTHDNGNANGVEEH